MKYLSFIFLLVPLVATAQTPLLYAQADIIDRIELSRTPLTRPQQPKANDVAARHVRRAGRCFAAGLGIGLASVAIGQLLKGNVIWRVVPNTNIVLEDNNSPEITMLFGSVVGLGFGVAGGVHLIKAGDALGR